MLKSDKHSKPNDKRKTKSTMRKMPTMQRGKNSRMDNENFGRTKLFNQKLFYHFDLRQCELAVQYEFDTARLDKIL